MDLKNLNKATLKALIKEILREDPDLFKEFINEVLIDNDVISLRELEPRTKKFEMKIDDMEAFGEAFKAIA